jgi:putative membrane protein
MHESPDGLAPDTQPAAPHDPARRARALVLLGLGGLLLLLVVSYAGVGQVLERVQAMGWAAPLLFAPYLVINMLDTMAWRRALSPEGAARVPFLAQYLMRIAGEAVNSVTPTAAVGGEPVKAQLLRSAGVPGPEAVASVVIAKTALTLSQVAFILVGVPVLAARFGRPMLGAACFAVLVVVAIVFARFLVGVQRRGLVHAAWRRLVRWFPRSRTVARLGERAAAIDERLGDFYRIEQRAFRTATLWHFMAWLLGVAEVWIIMQLIGAPIAWTDALILESLGQPIRAAALFIPGGLGVQELGGAALCHLLGIADAPAVTLWLLKRARELFYDVVGIVYLAQQTALRRAPAAAEPPA